MQGFEVGFRAAPRRFFPVRVGAGALEALVADLARRPPAALLVVISDSTVGPLHAETLARRLSARGLRVERLTFPAGEASKTRETKAWLEDRLLELGAGRDCAVVAVGGGVTGDLAGFVAATWLRGVPVIQVPTSLLAMADAALGGKVAVNLEQGKNLVGSFHQPSGVYADVSVLSTLGDRELAHGFAEVIKSAAIADGAFFRWLESSSSALLGRSEEALEHAVSRCLRIKARVVARDEREAGRRAMLNFGHTVAHALETVTGYATPHGAAVAAGMCLEARLAVSATCFPRAHVSRLESLVQAFGLPFRVVRDVSVDALLAATRRDKKVREGQVHYALPARLGRMPAGDRVTVPVAESRLRDVIAETQG